MKATKYLFDIEPSVLDNYSYWGGLKVKIEYAKILYAKLDNTREDDERRFWVYQALEKTRNLLEERDEY